MNLAIVGATGAVGLEIIKVIEQRKFKVSSLKLFASPRSLGKTLLCYGKSYAVETLKEGCFKGIDLCFFDASDEVSKTWVPRAIEEGAFVIDNSSVYRLKEGVPLVVPEVNGELLKSSDLIKNRLVAGPNCTTVQLVVPLQALEKKFKMKRVSVSTYQSISGAGAAAVAEFKKNAHAINDNCIPRIGGFNESGFTSEEVKIMEETKKILGLPQLKVVATAARIPIERAHSESVQVECVERLSMSEIKKTFLETDSIRFIDDQEIIQAKNAAHSDSVDVGRVRLDPSVENGLLFWVVSDNLRKGAALNAVQIAEKLLSYGSLSDH